MVCSVPSFIWIWYSTLGVEDNFSILWISAATWISNLFQSRLWGSCHNQVQIILSFQPVLQRLGPNPTNFRSCDFSEKVHEFSAKAFAREIHIASYCFKVLRRRCKTSILVSPLPHLIPRSQLTVKRKGVLHDFHMQNSQETASKTQSQSYLRGCSQDSREWWSTRQQVHQVAFKWHLKTNYITNTWSASKSSFSPGYISCQPPNCSARKCCQCRCRSI